MARWYFCNVLQPGQQLRQLWQFNAASSKFNLLRQETKLPSEPLPEKLVAKDWQTLFQPRLNVAWLPANRVFLRVVQLPKADLAETQSMVELQLEKVSPLPVAQIVWSFQVVPLVKQTGLGQELQPHATGELQTVIVIMAARHHVEEFLGELEGQGFLADRLELPLLDELRATKINGNGAWVYPDMAGQEGVCLVAWWYDGVLQNLSLLHLPPGENRAAALQEQLAQTAWAGELEGWVTSPPKFYLVASEAAAGAWLPLFDSSRGVELVSPLQPQELAALTARRVVGDSAVTNLLPPEYSTRYKQQFIDRLWMRGLGAVVLLYVAGLAVYFGMVWFASWKVSGVQGEVAKLSSTYTNAIRLKEQLRVLQDTLDLQYAALECYKAVADNLPSELTLDNLNFERGRTLTLVGTAGIEDRDKIIEFNRALLAARMREQPLFAKVNISSIRDKQLGSQLLSWVITCELKRTDLE
jgi:hypothetical protein